MPALPDRLILDASVTIAWLFNEADAKRRIAPILTHADLVTPWLWRLEVVNAVLVAERRKNLSMAEAAHMLELLEDLKPELIGEPPGRSLTELASLARPHQLTSYDALYLDLAISLNLPLFTRDNNLRTAAERVGVSLVKESAT